MPSSGTEISKKGLFVRTGINYFKVLILLDIIFIFIILTINVYCSINNHCLLFYYTASAKFPITIQIKYNNIEYICLMYV